ncbi:MAG: helix-turn-helix transcriptional regulator [Nitrospirota bacterium]
MMIRAIRHRQKLTLKMLAKKAGGMSYTFLSNVETGKADPSLSTLKRLATALGVSISELVKDPPAESKRRP